MPEDTDQAPSPDLPAVNVTGDNGSEPSGTVKELWRAQNNARVNGSAAIGQKQNIERPGLLDGYFQPACRLGGGSDSRLRKVRGIDRVPGLKLDAKLATENRDREPPAIPALPGAPVRDIRNAQVRRDIECHA